MSVINTNVTALYAQNALKTNARAQSTAMEQLSTGTRVNSAKDDAAGLAIGQNQNGRLQSDDTGNAPGAIFRRGVGQIRDFAFTQNLYAIRVDVIQITHQIGAGAGGANRHLIEAAL